MSEAQYRLCWPFGQEQYVCEHTYAGGLFLCFTEYTHYLSENQACA